jgi:hypothetical protein
MRGHGLSRRARIALILSLAVPILLAGVVVGVVANSLGWAVAVVTCCGLIYIPAWFARGRRGCTVAPESCPLYAGEAIT